MKSSARRLLGKRTGVEVTELGLGTAPLGETFDVIEEDEARALLAAAWDGGVRYFDTSPWYGKGQAEHRLGRALYRRPRDEYVISSKVGRVLRRPSKSGPFQRDSDWIGGLEFAHDMDYSYDGVMRSFEDSLQRLGINRIDVLLIHDLDTWHFKTEAKVAPYWNQLATSGWRALESLRDQGVIKGIGAGFNTMGTIPKYLDAFDMDFFLIAMRYTLLEQDVLDEEFPACERRGVGIVIGGTYNSGILATGAVPHARYNYAPAGPEILARVAKMEAVCKRHGVPLAAAALQFPLGHDIVASVIPGAISEREVAQNIASFHHAIPADLWAELKHEKLIRADSPIPGVEPMKELETTYRAYLDCLNARDWDALASFVEDDVSRNGERLGVEGYRAMLENDVRVIPDLVFRIELLAVDPPLVAARLRFDCSPLGVFLGLPVNGQRVSFTENVFYQFRDGKIGEVWSVIDTAAIEAQLQEQA